MAFGSQSWAVLGRLNIDLKSDQKNDAFQDCFFGRFWWILEEKWKHVDIKSKQKSMLSSKNYFLKKKNRFPLEKTMMLYLALWVRINCICKCLNCSSFGYPRGVYMIGMTRNNIDLQAQAEHHSITGDWEVYMGRHHGIDFHPSHPPVKL